MRMCMCVSFQKIKGPFDLREALDRVFVVFEKKKRKKTVQRAVSKIFRVCVFNLSRRLFELQPGGGTAREGVVFERKNKYVKLVQKKLKGHLQAFSLPSTHETGQCANLSFLQLKTTNSNE